MYAPLNYPVLNEIQGTYTPSCVKNFNNKAFAFWVRALFHRACSSLIIDLPAEWTEYGRRDFFYYCLFRNGFVGVANELEFGTFFQPCTLGGGFDFYYQPVEFIVSNPKLNKTYTIGVDGELIKLTPDFMGVWDVITYYAEKLALLDSAINMSLINNKYAFILGAKDKASGEALKKVLDKVNKGEPAVVYDMKILNGSLANESEPWQTWERPNLKQSYLTTEQLEDFNTIMRNFDTEIGIPTVDEKKERMVVAETESKTLDATSRCVVWRDTLKSCFDVINAKYGLNLSVRLRADEVQEGSAEDGKTDSDRSL